MLENNDDRVGGLNLDSEKETYPGVEPNQSNPIPPHHDGGLTKSQKIAAAVLAFFAFFIVIFWSMQFKSNLNISLSPPVNNNPDQPAAPVNNTGPACTGPNCPGNEDELRNSDTDGDGLSDYDELNIYKTSPYLEDSDSDGYSDKTEIDSDNDPNCPRGQDCTGGFGYDSGSPVQTDTASQDPLAGNLSTTPDSSAAGSPSDIMDIDPQSLRQMLLEQGVSQDMLDQISDDQLMQTFNETMSEQTTGGQ